ncbi:MAG TPA: diguanylate cyclase [Defluviitaleaceae bacterium]|nr:diguanylate cyclase [Candidatus Epulonipiscium sp.]HOQ16214.1 diguanylate cyclase [Defluviitaleaceae bacterium]HPT75166.1 diguanylate cyclase [Defluviitaleaceae bacterium]HQD50601.1 diguanylate cyclase [Defluviitaleaceae bacterium]
MREQVLFMKRTIENKEELIDVFSKNKIELITSHSTEETLDILDEKFDKIDLLIIDMEEDPIFGLKSIKTIKKINDYKYIPIVIIANKKDVMKGLTMGAKEYFIPPYDYEKLCSFVQIILKNKRENMHLYTPETSIDMSFEQYFNSEIKRAERGGYELAILILTIVSKDHNLYTQERTILTMINQLVDLVRQNLRATDTIVRYNRSNVIAFLPYTSRFNGEIVYEKILEIFNEKILANVDSKNNFEMVYSIASYPQDGDTVEDLLFNAERFLEDNKTFLTGK